MSVKSARIIRLYGVGVPTPGLLFLGPEEGHVDRGAGGGSRGRGAADSPRWALGARAWGKVGGGSSRLDESGDGAGARAGGPQGPGWWQGT